MHCESCDHGYTPTATHCPWCGASAQLAHVSHTVSVYDTECYKDYWLCKFDTGEVFQLTHDSPLDVDGLRRTLSRYTLVSFNGINYDVPIISLALQGHDNATLKAASDAIIVGNKRPWEITRDLLEWCDHIDMIEVAPGQASLKMYGAKMHSRKLQDLPIRPDASIAWHDRVLLRDYCDNDLRTTRELYDTFQAQLKLRADMSAEYGVDLRSKSDAQIAEAVMKKLLSTDVQWQSLDNQQRIANAMGRPFLKPQIHSDIYATNVVMQSSRSAFKVERPYIAAGTQFKYRAPEWLRFVTGNLIERIEVSPFFITPDGGIAPAYDNHLVDWGDKAVRLDIHGAWVKRPEAWEHELVTFGTMSYAMGIGGLHSTESRIYHKHDPRRKLHGPDVAAYYPSLIVRLGIYPKQIGTSFVTTYGDWKRRRDIAKIANDKKTANSLKTLNNGTFGKLNSKYSIFYAPAELVQVTITGQLALLMLIEMCELSGLTVISANTDGIVVSTPTALEWVYADVIAWWEQITGMVMEDTQFRMLACRDVNSYVGITTDGAIKLKGAFAPPLPGASGWPNPTGQVCVDAVVAYLAHGTPLRDTVYACQDVRQFVYVRQVKGGGSYLPTAVPPRSTTLAAMRAFGATGATNDELRACYAALRESTLAQAQYLGKAVRWYYAVGSAGCIITPAGGLVARTEGCVPLMELPDTLPADIDREWYVREAVSLLADLGVTYG